MNKKFNIDLTGIHTIDQLHDLLKKAFGFPDFYGRNYPALVDCWTSLRCPQDGMSEVVLDSMNDCLELYLKNLASCTEEVIRTLISAAEAVNQRAILT